MQSKDQLKSTIVFISAKKTMIMVKIEVMKIIRIIKGFLWDNDTKTEDDVTAARVSRWKVVITLLFNHCKEMKRLQEVADSKDVFEELGFVKCYFYQDQNDTFSTTFCAIQISAKGCIMRCFKGSHSSGMGCSHLLGCTDAIGCSPIWDVEMPCTADLSLTAAPILSGLSLATGLYSRRRCIKTLDHQSH